MRDYDERLYDGDVNDCGLFGILDDFDRVFRPTDESDPNQRLSNWKKTGKGRCTECNQLLEPWELGWDGKDGSNHLTEYDVGGGNVGEFACGPVFKEDE